MSKKTDKQKGRWVRRAAGNERGQVLVIFALSSVVLIGMCGFAIDFARILYARTVLQASSDAAAAAGAQDLPDTVTANSVAIQYSSLAAQKNFRTNMTGVSMSAGYPQSLCLTSSGLPACPVSAGDPWSVAKNALRVRQQVTVPMYFAGILGVPPMVVTATSTAGMKGGGPPPMDIVIVLDATWSMGTNCSAGGTKLDCAKNGIRTLLTTLWPCPPGPVCSGSTAVYDQVGLVVFPPAVSSAARTRELDCINNITSSDLNYDNASNINVDPNYLYTIAAISNNFKTASVSALNASSDMVKAVTLGNCGLETPPNPLLDRYSTSFATAIEKAQTMLDAANLVTGRNKAQDVIIVVGDGGANYAPVYFSDTSSIRKRPCQTAIDAANNIASSKGTWIYSVAYDSTGNCVGWNGADTARTTNRFSNTDESPLRTALYTMQELASDPTKFYNQPNAADLTGVFKRIAADLTTTRLVSDDTP